MKTVRFYEGLTTTTLDMGMDIPEAGLHVVAVGPFLILGMDTTKLDRAGPATETHVTVLNAHLDDAVGKAVDAGRADRAERWDSPPGPGLRVRHPDGLLVEYRKHRPSTDDVAEPGEGLR